MLGGPGVRSLDWIARDLATISGAVDLARWYAAHMGMRVSVGESGVHRQVARINDTGPIAFHEVTVPVPTSGRERIAVRLSFVVDQWRIDRIAVAQSFRRAAAQAIRVSRVESGNADQDMRALRSVGDPDEDYLVTTPSQMFRVVFDVPPSPAGTRTYMLASQGYYIEWVRGSWIKNAAEVPFEPGEGALLRAVEKWRAQQSELERQFYASRIPVR